MGDGQAIKFWHDTWLTDEPLFKSDRDKVNINSELRVCHLLNSEREWDHQKIQRLLSSQLSNELITKIIGTNIPRNHFQDRLYWKESKNGWFSTKSSVNLIHKNKAHKKSDLQWIWDLDCAPKLNTSCGGFLTSVYGLQLC